MEDHILSRTENLCAQEQSTSHKFLSSRSNSITNASNPLATNHLIDLDLISGSAYRVKSKFQQGWISTLFNAILRVIFFPLYLRWWSEKTNSSIVGLLFLLYLMQLVSIRLYYQKNLIQFYSHSTTFYNHSNNNNNSVNSTVSNLYSTNINTNNNSKSSNEFSEISATEVLMPIAMMIVLGIIHTQIVGTKIYKSSNTNSSMFNSVKNVSTTGNTNDIICQNQHTDCSSSSASSASSSVDSSPVANVKHRIQNRISRLEKFKNDFNDDEKDDDLSVSAPKSTIQIPKIRFLNEVENNNTLLINNDQKDQLLKQNFNKNSDKNSAPPKIMLKRRKLKPRNNSKSSATQLTSNISSWNYDDDHLNSSLCSLRSSFYGSSFDSEGTISPMTPLLMQVCKVLEIIQTFLKFFS